MPQKSISESPSGSQKPGLSESVFASASAIRSSLAAASDVARAACDEAKATALRAGEVYDKAKEGILGALGMAATSVGDAHADQVEQGGELFGAIKTVYDVGKAIAPYAARAAALL